ncbi:sodium:solute symporter family protein [Chlorobaculum limnaeum]|nr:sodium:solute symporter family protein [Chlorobaculum limnaeum]
MNIVDVAIVVVYLFSLFAWAIYIGMRETAEDFLVLSRKAPFFLVAFSVISTWVGIGTTVATAASGYDTGISLAVTAGIGGIAGIFVAAWFAPRLKWFGDIYEAHTLGDFFYRRYSVITRTCASVLVVAVYLMLTAAQFVGLGALVKVWSGIDFEIIIAFSAISTVIYTAFAGIKSDFYTDVIHFIVMFFVLFIMLLPIVMGEVGGMAKLSELPSSYFDPFRYGGVSFFIAGLIFGAGSVFVTMEIWQRIYASASGKSARKALVLSVFVIISFYAVSAIFGMSAKILLPSLINRDHVLFVLMSKYLPVGMLGLGLAGFMAIFISTVNSTILVASATLAKDIYGTLYAGREYDLLKVSRVSTLIIGFLGMVIAYCMPDIVVLSVNAMFMLLILLPSVIGGFFWKRANAKAAFASIIVGFMVMLGFLSYNPNTAFVPGFVASMLVFIFVSLYADHDISENLEIVNGWRDEIFNIKTK